MSEAETLGERARIASMPDELRPLLERALRSWQSGDCVEAAAACDGALAVAEEMREELGVFHALHLRACVAYTERDYALSRALHNEVLARSREIEFLGGMGSSLCDIAMIDLAEGDVDGARIRYERGLACYEEGGYFEHAEAARALWEAADVA